MFKEMGCDRSTPLRRISSSRFRGLARKGGVTSLYGFPIVRSFSAFSEQSSFRQIMILSSWHWCSILREFLVELVAWLNHDLYFPKFTFVFVFTYPWILDHGL